MTGDNSNQDRFLQHIHRRQFDRLVMRRQFGEFLKRTMQPDYKYNPNEYDDFRKKRSEEIIIAHQRDQRINFMKNFLDQKNTAVIKNEQAMPGNVERVPRGLADGLPVKSLDLLRSVLFAWPKRLITYFTNLLKPKTKPAEPFKAGKKTEPYPPEKKAEAAVGFNRIKNKQTPLAAAGNGLKGRQVPAAGSMLNKVPSAKPEFQTSIAGAQRPASLKHIETSLSGTPPAPLETEAAPAPRKKETFQGQQDHLQSILRQQINKDSQMVL